jgi:hypothetical protein
MTMTGTSSTPTPCRLLRLLAVALLLLSFLPRPMPAMAQAATPANPQALATYEQGKKLYDAGDYAGARSRFIEAIRIEPDNARWHYNLGLVHRQMDNFQAARQSLLKARELDPDYKRAEIDQKLASMGFGAADNTAGNAQAVPQAVPDDGDASFVLWMVAGVFGVVIAFIGMVFWLIRRGGSAASPATGKADVRSAPPPGKAEVAALRNRTDTAAAQLVGVEHALRLGEHADLRNQLDHATRIESALREQLAQAAAGDGHAFRKAGRAIVDLEDSTQRATALAKSAFGDAAFAAQGDRAGCYFCARPLANAEYRRPVAVKRGNTHAEVIACPPCALAAQRGEAPAILASADGKTHWSETPDFDPYAARHQANGELRRLPAWRFAPQRSFGELAMLAGGAALAGGALAALARPAQAAPTLDLDAAREAGLAQEAARATAQRAAEQRSERFADHS